MGDVPEGVKKCVAILRAASSDTEKFAALFMVTKLVKGSDCNAHAKKLLFEAIGFTFLKKLLLSTDVPEDCPPLVYKSVAMSVLSSFCAEPELATHPEMLKNIPVFLEIVQQADDDALDDDLIVISEAYECLQAIASHEPGQKALLAMGAIAKMSEIYAQQSFQTDEALNILVTLVTRFGSNAWDEDPKPFHVIVNKIALDFETDHSERKFELCSILHALLFNCRREIVSQTSSDESWVQYIYKGLSDILMSKIGKAQRDPALKLASVMVEVLGVEWCLRDEEKPRQFFLLLVHLCSVEVRMQLEDRSMAQIMNNADLVTACFIVLELSIAFVATDTLDLEQKEKQQLYTALKGAFAAIMSTLVKVSKEPLDKKETKEKVFICAMVRVLGAWLVQETSAMKNAVNTLLPFMLTLANETFYAYRARRTAERARGVPPGVSSETSSDPLSQVDILRLLLPAMCHLTVDEKARKIMLDVKEEEALYECVLYHWSIVHYKKPVIPKSERGKVKKGPEPEPDPSILDEMKDSRTAMISICNIFMNITVLEANMVEESTLFSSLLKFIFNNLPELKNVPENLVLHGNLAVLGLLLLKQQAKRARKNDFSICRYIQATIRFLWDAFSVNESHDSSTLVVSMSYKQYWMELQELWFLGMQTMSAVLALVPWLSEFAIESGWAQGIIDTLKQVKMGSLPANTKSAYEDFLCHLVDANNSVTQVLKERDALTVCRTHRFMELGKRLFVESRAAAWHRSPSPLFPASRRLSAPQLVGTMKDQYGVLPDDARQAADKFLTSFRKCPDNNEVGLDEWRLALWVDALGNKYANIAAEVYKQWVELRYHCLSLRPEVAALLSALRPHYLLALVTNGPSCAQWEKVQRLELGDYFDTILVSGDLPWEKPHRNIFLQACHCLGVQPCNCLMVGDKLETDIQGGVNARLGGTVWVIPSYGVSDTLDGNLLADFSLSAVTDLLDILPPQPVCPSISHPRIGDMPLSWKTDSCTQSHDAETCINVSDSS